MALILSVSLVSLLLFSLPLMAHPLSFGLVLLSTTLVSAIISALLASSWYGYIIFIIFIGGLLVMFAYVAALAPNAFFKPPRLNIIIALLLLVFVPLLIITFSFPLPTTFLSYTNPLYVIKSSTLIYTPAFFSTLFFLMYILLLTILAVAKICSFSIGPLRPFIYLFSITQYTLLPSG